MALPLHHFAGLLAMAALPAIGPHAQSAPVAQSAQSAHEQTFMAQATLIFEGELVQAVGYFNADSNRVYRTAVIGLTHLVKGTLAPGTVQVVYKGPKVAGLSTDPKTGELWVELPSENGHGHPDNQGMTLPANKPTLFFCRPLPVGFAPKPPHLTTDNALALEIVGAANDLFGDHSIVSDVGGRFADFPALYRYLEDTYHLPPR